MTTLTLEMLHAFTEERDNRPPGPWSEYEISYFKSYLSDSLIKDMVFPATFSLYGHYAYDALFENVVFLKTNIFDANMKGSAFKNCQFINVCLQETILMETEFMDCIFSSCKITNTSFHDASIKNLIICNSELTGVSFSGSSIENFLLWRNQITACPSLLEKIAQGIHSIENTFIEYGKNLPK